MKNLVWIEISQTNGKQTMAKASVTALNAAQDLGGEIHALVIGHNVTNIVQNVACIHGVLKVFHLDSLHYQYALSERLAPVITRLIHDNGYYAVLAAATAMGKEMLPRVAAMLDVMQVSEVTKVIDERTFERFIYAGSAIETVRDTQENHVLTVRSSSFSQEYQLQETAPIEQLIVNCDDMPLFTLSECTSPEQAHDNGSPELSSAKIVVAGGGGLSADNAFDVLVSPLAEKLGAALGASKVPVDNGQCGSQCLVGQTGKAISPELYLAFGISGANQHVTGMKESKTIIAINNDANAPIFNYADYGLVGDAKEIIPALLLARLL